MANKIAKPLFCSDEQKYRKINIYGQRVSRLDSDEETTWWIEKSVVYTNRQSVLRGIAKALRDSREFEATEAWEEGVIGASLAVGSW